MFATRAGGGARTITPRADQAAQEIVRPLGPRDEPITRMVSSQMDRSAP